MKTERRRVVIQGFRGSYHEIAASKYFGSNIEIIPTLAFDEMFRMLERDNTLSCVFAIENTVSGSILSNYTMLKQAGLFVTGECSLRISLNLLAFPGQSIGDVLEVRSHPLALVQCRDFFDSHPGIRLIESADTALSAKEISESRLMGAGVIASRLAAKLYGLEVIEEEIASDIRNFTRFLIIEPAGRHTDRKAGGEMLINKASVVFSLPHRKGSLVELLSVFADRDCNLTTLQSTPIVGSEWEYLFYADMVFSSYEQYMHALEEAGKLCHELTIIGEYREGNIYEE
ncbi:MAG: prephenate dehydratase [Bacteroidales bacterium]|jgi:prephenate dehydratase|nr:prephenate dehydratase [Bacteroidales bacterium]